MLKRNKWISLLLILVMIVGLLAVFSGCGKEEQPAEEEMASGAEAVDLNDAEEMGKGDHHFYLIAYDEDGDPSTFSIYTNEKTVGEALDDLGLIEVDEREYGMYVEEVNGVEVNYTEEGQYWAFFVNDEFATDSVDSTEIEEDAVYMFRIEQAW